MVDQLGIKIIMSTLWAGIGLCIICIICFLLVKKQRSFPYNLSVWVVMIDLVAYAIDIFRFSNYSASDGPPDHRTCQISNALDITTFVAQAVANLFLSFTLWNMIVRRKNMRYSFNPRYLWVMAAVIVIYPPAVGLIGAFYSNSYDKICFPLGALYIIVGNWSVVVLIECAFLLQIARYVITVKRKSLSLDRGPQTMKNRRTTWLVIRLGSIIVLQTVPAIFWNVAHVFFYFPEVLLYYILLRFFCYTLEAVVLTVANERIRGCVLHLFRTEAIKEESSEPKKIQKRPISISIIIADDNNNNNNNNAGASAQ